MSERRLNFNAPLMSVRRFSNQSTTSSRENGKKPENAAPFSNSDFTLDPITEPVAIPFHWEQIPGQARNDSKLESAKEINEDDDDDYSDALDILSLTDSFSHTNCSVSGLSGSDSQHSKPSGTFLIDPQTRDFMMRRFLPAAKAMALDRNSPLKKQLVPFEQPRQVQKGAVDESRKPLLKPNVSSSNMIVPYGQIYKEVEEEEEEESEDDHKCDDDSSNVLAKGCGIFPGLCFKRNSLSLLNTVPALKISGKIRNVQKISYGSYKHKSEEGVVGSLKHSLEEAKKNKWMVESMRFTSPIRRSSPLRHSRGASPFRNNRAPQAPNGMHLLEFPSKVDNYKLNWLHHERINAPTEKTLYIDAVNIAEKSSLSGGEKSKLLEVSFPKGNESNEEIEYLQGDNQIVKFDGNSKKQNRAVPPPLLKSPSESWLGRMLPSKPMQMSSLSQKKMSSTNNNTNWETIVKASYLHHDHIRYSEELTAHVMQHPKT